MSNSWAYARAEDADQMIGVGASEGGVVVGEFIGDPSAAGHGYVIGEEWELFLRPSGAGYSFLAVTHGLRLGLHSCAASRLRPRVTVEMTALA